MARAVKAPSSDPADGPRLTRVSEHGIADRQTLHRLVTRHGANPRSTQKADRLNRHRAVAGIGIGSLNGVAHECGGIIGPAPTTAPWDRPAPPAAVATATAPPAGAAAAAARAATADATATATG